MEKIKKSMRREDGFTLVELLAVIVILGIILAIAIPAVGGVIKRADDESKKAENNLILDAARLYFTAVETPENPVDVETLMNQGFLEERGKSLESRKDDKVTKEVSGELTGSWEAATPPGGDGG